LKLTVGAKISGGFAVIIFLIIGMVGFSYYSLQEEKANLTNIQQASERQGLADDVLIAYKNAIAGLRNYVAFGDENVARQVEGNLDNVIKLEKQLLAIARPEKAAMVKVVIDETAKYRELILKDYMPAAIVYNRDVLAGNYARAAENKTKLSEVARAVLPLARGIEELLDEMSRSNSKLTADTITDSLMDASTTMKTLLILGAVALLLGIVIAVFLTNMIRRPIIHLSSLADQYAAGDLRNQVTHKSQDEMGDLANSLRKMNENFRAMVKNIALSSEQVAASSEELTASADHSAQAANQVAVTIAEVAKGMETQQKAVNETAAAVEQMSAGIEQIAANANIVASESDKTSNAAHEGGKAVSKAVAQINSIEKTVLHSSDLVSQLGERSKEIGQIVDTIANIAGQTNLLALNAAIEAARAGDQGRGFAVVAEEVRKLAEQSQEAAKEIAQLIGDIQENTTQAVKAMAEGTREVRLGTEVVNTAGLAFNEISKLIENVSDQVRDISASIQQLASGSQQIVDSVREVNNVAKNIAGQTQTVSAATQEQSASVEEIAAASQALAKLAQELQAATQRFRL